ncbi:MAG: hypothetical protein AAF850_03435, partial [Pseudomonadota bacterium]
LRVSIFKKLKNAGIEIPFPQRDLNIRNGVFAQSAQSASPEIGERPHSEVTGADGADGQIDGDKPANAPAGPRAANS